MKSFYSILILLSSFFTLSTHANQRNEFQKYNCIIDGHSSDNATNQMTIALPQFSTNKKFRYYPDGANEVLKGRKYDFFIVESELVSASGTSFLVKAARKIALDRYSDEIRNLIDFNFQNEFAEVEIHTMLVCTPI